MRSLMVGQARDSLSERLVDHLAAQGVSIKSQPITEVVPSPDGGQAAYSAIFLGTECQPENELARALGCELSESGHILVNDTQETSVEGVYAAGDVALQRGQKLPVEQVIFAAAGGATRGWAINQRFTFEDWNLGRW